MVLRAFDRPPERLVVRRAHRETAAGIDTMSIPAFAPIISVKPAAVQVSVATRFPFSSTVTASKDIDRSAGRLAACAPAAPQRITPGRQRPGTRPPPAPAAASA